MHTEKQLRSLLITFLKVTYFEGKIAGVEGWGGLVAPIFLLHISSSWVKIRLHTENQLPSLPVSALKV